MTQREPGSVFSLFNVVPLWVGFGIFLGLCLLIGANAHLVYVAIKSHPECVPHLKDISQDSQNFRAAKSAC